LRRLVAKTERPGACRLRDVMTTHPKTVTQGDRVSHTLNIMRQFKIDEIPVIDDAQHVIGMIDIQDLLAAGFSLFDTR
jgi:CBS domain-containing protein